MEDKYIFVAKGISRWKINNRLENILSHLADKSECWKKIYVLFYKFFDSNYYKKGKKMIEYKMTNLSSSFALDNVNQKQLIRDAFYSLHRFGATFDDYLQYNFIFLNSFGRKQYLTLKMQYALSELLNTTEIKDICENKFKTYEYLRSFYKREIMLLKDKRDLSKLIEFVKKHKECIFKPLRGHSGKSIYFINEISLNDKGLINRTLEWGGVIEEMIQQDDSLGILHPNSINTLRVATIKIKGNVKIYGAALRMGTGEKIVDNAGSGGIYANIETETGIVDTDGVNVKGERYLFHPDTNIAIPGFKIPYWKECKEMVSEMNKKLEGGNLLAWDLALSKRGWCLVEINDVGDPYLLQVPKKKGISPLLENLLKKYFETKSKA